LRPTAISFDQGNFFFGNPRGTASKYPEDTRPASLIRVDVEPQSGTNWTDFAVCSFTYESGNANHASRWDGTDASQWQDSGVCRTTWTFMMAINPLEGGTYSNFKMNCRLTVNGRRDDIPMTVNGHQVTVEELNMVIQHVDGEETTTGNWSGTADKGVNPAATRSIGDVTVGHKGPGAVAGYTRSRWVKFRESQQPERSTRIRNPIQRSHTASAEPGATTRRTRSL
jgi:hypothetical protein